MAVTKEVAEKEITEWLDSRRYPKKKREARTEAFDELVEAVESGVLIVNEDHTLTHKLAWPVDDVSEFKYAHRVTAGALQHRMQAVKPGDAFGAIAAHICAVANQPLGVVKGLDTVDYGVAQSVALFFMS